MRPKLLIASFVIALITTFGMGKAAHAGLMGSGATAGSLAGTFCKLTGCTFTGPLSMGTNPIYFNGIDFGYSAVNTLITPAIIQSSTGFRVGGIYVSFDTNGIACQAGSARCGIRQQQSAMVSTYLGGFADAANEVAVRLGTTVTDGSGGSSADLVNMVTDEDGTPSVKFRWKGNGMMQTVAQVSAANDLPGQEACAAAGDVGKEVMYSDTSTSKISKCICEQTGAATFAWGAATATGDCT